MSSNVFVAMFMGGVNLVLLALSAHTMHAKQARHARVGRTLQ